MQNTDNNKPETKIQKHYWFPQPLAEAISIAAATETIKRRESINDTQWVIETLTKASKKALSK